MRRFPSRMPSVRGAAVVSILFLAVTALSYPISPVTLWELVEHSELIVLADVEAVVPAPPSRPGEERSWDSHVARLRVLETWKGRAGETLEVPFPQTMICPAPPVYDVGHRVLAFLAWHHGRLSTVALSYGTRYPETAADEDAFRTAVKEAIVLQTNANLRPASTESKRAWQIRRVGHDATRWDGLYGLVPSSDAVHARYDRSGNRDSTLSPEELKQFALAFVQEPPVDSTLPLMLRVLREVRDPEVTQAAVDAFDAALKAAHFPWWAEETLALIRERLGMPEEDAGLPDPVAQTFKDAATAAWSRHAPDVEEGVQRAWLELQRELRLTPRSLKRVPADNRTRPVGGNTSL